MARKIATRQRRHSATVDGIQPKPGTKGKSSRKMLGRYIVADPEIRAGRPTIVGTRVMVTNVLEQLALGLDWDRVVEQFNGHFPREAVAEVIDYARKVLAGRDNRILARATRA